MTRAALKSGGTRETRTRRPWPTALAVVLLVIMAVGAAAGAGSGQAAERPLPPPAKPVPGLQAAAPPAQIAAGGGASSESDVALAMRPLAGPPRPPGPKPAIPRPTEAELIAAAGFQPDQVGYLVYDLDTGAYLGGHNATRAAFLPASVLKIPTTVAALAVLGPDHRFPTLVRFDGDRLGRDGLWTGTLALVGGGDPVLDSEALRALVGALKAAGLTRLEGRFVYDDSALVATPALEPSQPAEHAYNPGLSALSLDFNRIRVRWDGDRVRVVETHDTPPVAPVRLTRASDPAGWSRAGPPLRHAFPAPGTRDARGLVTEVWRLSPYAPERGAAWLPVKAPGPFVAAVFRALAAEAGITLPEPEPAPGPARGPIVARHFSPPLSAIAANGLKYSNNLLAELLGLATTARLDGRPHDLAGSAARLERWLAQTLPWVDWTGFRMANHSGLSPDSRASPEQVVALLRFAEDQGAALAPRTYDALLPPRRFPDSDATRLAAAVHAGDVTPRVWAKSGTMYHGRGLAGFARGASGHRLVFAVFTSDLAARRAFDAGYLHYAGGPVARARDALRRARDLEHALLLTWITRH
ncbi:D-alanyl-D-alanine carboxypeptidase/D-alanyl-D-alanine endopeptidase [Roseospira goensis]|uniref:D-alanyl-D-alanine carboxypeptidase/D-alanyl-D-alanine-endopeptidase (Penicillin-binding protein 4) n=1 Tax=Roseospira goensis TaxID=391922 RepID=A0A7W6RW32_9PROT|nr:D-alanyl-D-alanine carboxypeptidase/D-alanyl-D-alanine-endopeptidase [Roseospira goensis]MBB4284329.1 D-alanyl-D-alanine carboxypeptidase/D-alanyl-D-alanine-endopeptidase (penicillin-binding protein 4) [Roseospira goensis]